MKKLQIVLTILLLVMLVSPLSSYGKNKVSCLTPSKKVNETTFNERVKLKVKEIQKKNKRVTPIPNPLTLKVTGAVIGKQLHTSALGYKIKPGECAISQDMISLLGKKINIGAGVGKDKELAPVGVVKVACVMPRKWKKKLDVYVTSKSKAYALTGKRNIKVL